MLETEMENTEQENLIEDGKNKTMVHCVRCPSKILNPLTAKYSLLTDTFLLPHMHEKDEQDITGGEEICAVWEVADMYSFENVGFSKNVNDKKYLTCADCEIGPIGWHDIATKINYVALTRVKHN